MTDEPNPQAAEKPFIPKLLKLLFDQQVQNAAFGSNERSLIAIHYDNGAPVEGWLVDYGSSRTMDNEPLVIVYSSIAKVGGDIIGTPVSSIKGLTILKVVERAQPPDSPPSVDRLQGVVKEIEQLLEHILEKKIPGELAIQDLPETAFGRFELQLNGVRKAFVRLLAFPAAQETLRHKIDTFKIQFGGELSSAVQETALHLAIPLDPLSEDDVVTSVILAFSMIQ